MRAIIKFLSAIQADRCMSTNMMVNQAKKAAAEKAVDNHIKVITQ